MKPMRIVGLASVVLLAGCVLPPKTQPQFSVVDDATLGLGALNTVRVDRWWRDFNDEQFDAFIEAALQSNPSLQDAIARVGSAQAQHQAAAGGRLPHFEIQSKIQREKFPEHFIYPPPFAGGMYWDGSILANLSWDLDFWGKQSQLIKSASAETAAASYDVAAARLMITSSIAQAYLDLNRAYALVDIAKEAETQRRQILDITRKRIDAGLDTHVELREAEAAVPQAELSRLQAEAASEVAMHRLIALMGKGAAEYSSVKRPTLNVAAALAVPAELPADLLGRRPDILAAKARIESAAAQRASARADFYPNINLGAFIGVQAIGLDQLFDSDTFGAGPAISLPIFDSIRLKAAFNSATAAEDVAIVSYNDAIVRAVQQVADQLSYVRSTALQLDRAQAVLTASEEAYRLAQKRYQAGLANYLSVLATETQVLQARTNYVDIVHAQAFARIALLIAVGGNFNPAA